MSLKADFADEFAGSAFGEVAGDKALVGKWGSIVELDDGTYDAWFHNVHDLSQSLTGRRLAKIERECLPEHGFVKLTGEGYARGQGRDFVLRMAALAGIKRRRRLSPEAREKAAENLRVARAAQNRSQ